MQRARRAWLEALPGTNVESLVFIDETWTSTSVTRRCRRAPKGKLCIASAPHGHWKTTTFVGALRHRRLTAPMVTDGPMDGEMFLAYAHQFLCPTLQPGDIVILDNLSSHKVSAVAETIRAAGASLLYLPLILTTSTLSRSSSPNSKHCSAKQPNDPSTPYGRKSVTCSTPSRKRIARTSSPRADM